MKEKTAAGETRTVSRLGSAVPVLLIAGLCLAVYGNTLGNGFVYDDYGVVEGNAAIRQWSSLPDLFRPGYFRAFGEYTYRPLVSLTYMIDYSFWRLKPAGYHLTNLLLHAVNGILLYLLLRFLLKRPLVALAAALFFVVHPITTEAVNAICFREDLLVTCLGLLSFLAFTRQAAAEKSFWQSVFLGSGFLFLALFAKETALIFPALFLLAGYCFRQRSSRSWKKRIFVYAGLLSAVGGYCLIRFYLLRNPGKIVFVPPALIPRVLRESETVFLYLGRLLFPLRLSAEYYIPTAPSLRDPAAICALIGLAALVGLLLGNRRRFPELFFCAGWFFLALLPAADVIPLHNPIAERYLYLPSAGFCLSLALGGEYLFTRRRFPARPLLPAALVLLLAAYSGRTILRNRDWKDPLTFYRKNLETCPRSARFLSNLGQFYHTRGQEEEALAAFRKAVEADPAYADAYVNMGSVYAGIGRNEEAKKAIEKALTVDPASALGHYALGNVDLALGRGEDAIESFRRAIEIDPAFAMAYNNLGVAYNAAGREKEAAAVLEKAIALDPGYAMAHNNLGNSFRALGRREEAAITYRKAIALRPDYADACCNLGMVYDELGRREEAAAEYRRAIEIDPLHAAAHFNLAVSYYYRGKREQAVDYCERARRLGYRVPAEFSRMLEK